MDEFIALVVQVISARAVILLALLMTMGLFSWALWDETWIALADAALFAVIVFLPVLFRGSGNGKKEQRTDGRVHTVEPEHE